MKLLIQSLVVLSIFGSNLNLFGAATGISNGTTYNGGVTQKELESELIAAATNGELDVIKELIAKKVDVNCVDPISGETPLHKAAMLGRIDCIKLLLDEGADPNKPNRTSDTPFTEVLIHEKSDLIQLFIDAGANIVKSGNKLESLLDTPEPHLTSAIMSPKTNPFVDVLLTAGSSFNEAYFSKVDDNINFDLFGLSPLSLSKVRLKNEMIQDAIKGPLCIALQNNNGTALYTLLKNNISISEMDGEDLSQSCLSLMAMDPEDKVIWSAINGKLLSDLPSYGQITAVDPVYEMTPILWAAARNNVEVLKSFLSNEDVKANIMSVLAHKNEDKETAFTLAHKNGNTEVIKLLNEALLPAETVIGLAQASTSPLPVSISMLIMQYLLNTQK